MWATGTSDHFTLIATGAVTAISVIAAALDYRSGKIPNWLTLSALALGVIFSAVAGGWSGLLASVLGAFAALAVLGWMFVIGVMGGGDVKLLMALSAWMDFRFAIETAILSVLLGGLMAAGILVYRKRMASFVAKLKLFVLSITVKDLKLEPPKLDRTLTMPFGIAIAAGAVWTAWAHPLKAWGLLPW